MLAVPQLVAAAESGVVAPATAPISVQLKQFKVQTNAKGETKLTDAAVVLPGDVIEYRAVYANRSRTSLPVVATIPIPDALEYLPDSAKAEHNLAHSVAQKDGQFASEPLRTRVSTAGGATLLQAVPYSAYRFVRWDLGTLNAGGQIEVSVRARVAQGLDATLGAEDKGDLQVSAYQK